MEESSPLEFTLVSIIEGEPKGHFNGPKLLDSSCQSHTFRGLLESNTNFKLNWTYNGNKDMEGKINATFQ